MTIFTITGETRPEGFDIDPIGLLRTMVDTAGIPHIAGTVDDLGEALTTGPPLVHVVADNRTLSPTEASTLRSLYPELVGRQVPLSMFYGILRPEDVTDVFTQPALDQALEVRDQDSVTGAVTTILQHVHNSLAPPPGDTVTIGTVFPLGEGDYKDARGRALVSHHMVGFVTHLRGAMVRLREHPLATRLPWDPDDTQPATLAEHRSDGWQLRLTGAAQPNLTQVLNAHATAEARHRLSGDWTAQDDPIWGKAWAGGSKPPPLLLTGESGTGKTRVATFIADLLRDHQSPSKGRFVKVNCGALTAESVTHTLHGTGPGKWTGIDEAVPGELARAVHGVVFLDEIGDLTPDVQRALLTYLDDRLVRPTGVTPFRGFQHVIAATNRDVSEGATQQWFRNDLLARFTLRLHIPPLRERGINEIAQLLDLACQDPYANPLRDRRHRVEYIDATAYQDLITREYRDGNFRELQETTNAMLRSAIQRHSHVVECVDLPPRRPSHFRSDQDTARVHVAEVVLPEGTPVIPVPDERDLRLLAHRERRMILTDDTGTSWVLTSTVAYSTATDKGET